MSNLKKTRFIVMVLLLSMLLSGCIFKSNEEKIFGILEDVVAAEKNFEKQQEPLVELENTEKALYDKIISLGTKEHDQVVKLADEALEVLKERKERMEKEQESIVASKKEFEKVLPLIADLEEKEVQEKANQLSEVMKKRYEVHNELYKLYLEGIKADSELYTMLKSKDITIVQLDEQVTKSNETVKKVLEANEQFNEQTKKYNDAKLAFYKAAGFNVKPIK